MKEEEAKKYIIDDIIYRFKEEIKEHKYKVTSLEVKEQTDEEQTRTEIIEEYLDDTIEMTENEKDIVATKDLYNKWTTWIKGRYSFGSREQMLTQLTLKVFGNEVAKHCERGKRKDRQNKTISGFIKINYKSPNSKNVIDFMRKFLIKTEDKILDRIPLDEVYLYYRRWDSKLKIVPCQFHTIVGKEYKLKQACKYIEVDKENGKTKIEKVGLKYETKLCVMQVKWLPGAKEQLE